MCRCMCSCVQVSRFHVSSLCNWAAWSPLSNICIIYIYGVLDLVLGVTAAHAWVVGAWDAFLRQPPSPHGQHGAPAACGGPGGEGWGSAE